MKHKIGNYARHAQYWDWGGYDRTPEHEYWRAYAEKYGHRVLIPMCALGETGAYMAQHGLNVTAFDLTPEMIAEGKKRFGHLKRLTLLVGDVCDFRFDMPPADFAFSMDFGHLSSLDLVKRALICLGAHLRTGGCLVLEVNLRMPSDQSSETPPRTFEPFSQVYPGIRVYKTVRSRYDAQTGRQYIEQTFYAEDNAGHVDSFLHSFYLQNYYYEEWIQAFRETGFTLFGEYGSRELKTWTSSANSFRIFELVKC